MNILQFRGRIGTFLEPAPGTASLNLLRMAREGLMIAVHTAIHEAAARSVAIRKEGVRFKSRSEFARVDIEVMPILGPGDRCNEFYLVFFENYRPAAAGADDGRVSEEAPVEETRPADETMALRQELSATKEYLQSVVESQESFNEELRSANEEILSANEEFQSTNEELETAKEELQSANEDLTTLNEELHTRNEALAKANDDLNNLLNSINVAVVILDAELRVRRFTAVAEKLMNLIPTDIGRPFAHINPRIVLPDLNDVLRDVVDKLSIREFEVTDQDGHWYNLRIRPYKTVENRVDGALLVLMESTARRRVRLGRDEFQQRSLQQLVCARLDYAALAGLVESGAAGSAAAWMAPRKFSWGYAARRPRLRVFMEDGQGDPTRRSGGIEAPRLPPDWFRLAPFPYLVLSLRGLVVQANEVAGATFARRPASLVGWPFLRYVSADSARAYLDFLHECHRTTSASQDLVLKSAQGALAAKLLAAKVPDVGDNDLLLVTFEDLRPLREAEEAVRTAHALLERRVAARNRDLAIANEALRKKIDECGRLELQLRYRVEALKDAEREKDDCLAMLAHELRNPLAGLQNAIGVLQHRDIEDPTVAWVGELFQRQTRHLTRLVDDLLDVSRRVMGRSRLSVVSSM